MMFIENIFPPIPSEMIMPLAGSLATKGELNAAGVFVAGTLGALMGTRVIYFIGLGISERRARQ